MSDTYDGLPLSGEALKGLGDRGGICTIKARSRFVREDDRGVHQESAGNGNPLPLATGQTRRRNGTLQQPEIMNKRSGPFAQSRRNPIVTKQRWRCDILKYGEFFDEA